MRGRATSSGGIGGAVAVAMVWFMVGCGGDTAKTEGAGESAPTGGTSGTSGSQDAPAPVVNLANVDAGRTVVVTVGQRIDITLQTIGPGAYDAPKVSPSVVRFVDEFEPEVSRNSRRRDFARIVTGKQSVRRNFNLIRENLFPLLIKP